MKSLIRPARRFTLAIVLVLAFGGAFALYTNEGMSQEQRDEVLIKAIPFVAVFVAIVLAFIFVVVAIAQTLHGRVPERSYRPIEGLIVGGIVLGVLALFQGWRIFAYEYGFLLLLFSTLAFMIWSHITPMSITGSRLMPRLEQRAHVIGLIAGGLLWAVLAIGLILDARPTEPYGVRRQVWELMMTEEERTETAEAARSEHRTSQAPLFALISLLPGAIVYFATREAVSITRSHISLPAEEATISPVEVSELTAD